MARRGKPLFVRSILLSILLTASLNALGADDPDAALTSKTRRVVIFKDGYALVQRSGSATTDESGRLRTRDVPDEAVLGTFWAGADSGRLTGISAAWVESEETSDRQVNCVAPDEILSVNEGRQVTLRLNDGDTLEGTIVKVLRPEARLEVESPSSGEAWLTSVSAASEAQSPTYDQTLVRRSTSASHFVLGTERGDILLPISSVKGMMIDQMQHTRTETIVHKRRHKTLTFHHDSPNQQVTVNWMYFRPGFRWIPTYRIQLPQDSDADQLQVALQAEILNEAEDLDDAELDIVVGVPHFRFRDVPSPLSLERTLRNTLQQIAPVLSNQAQIGLNNAFQNSGYGARSQEFRAASAAAAGALDAGPLELGGGLNAAGAQDLFVYQLGRQSLARGQRLTIPVFTTQAGFRNVFSWSLDLRDSQDAPSENADNGPLRLTTNRVWRQLVITNPTELPWTTGPALVLQDSQPIAQELVTYTPAKNDVRVPVTVAVDVRASYVEREVNRLTSALQVGGYSYSLIEKEVTLDVCNNKNRAVPLEIEVSVPGEVTDAQEEGQVSLQAVSLDAGRRINPDAAVNKHSTVTWKRELEPGETFAPVIRYSYYLRY